MHTVLLSFHSYVNAIYLIELIGAEIQAVPCRIQHTLGISDFLEVLRQVNAGYSVLYVCAYELCSRREAVYKPLILRPVYLLLHSPGK